jgi:hypothetical protein
MDDYIEELLEDAETDYADDQSSIDDYSEL